MDDEDDMTEDEREAVNALASNPATDRVISKSGRIVALLSADWTIEAVNERVARMLVDKLEARVEERIDTLVQERFGALAEEHAQRVVLDALTRCLNDGFYATDEYGTRQKKIGSIRELVIERMQQYTKISDSYHRRSKFGELVDEAITKTLKAEIDELRAKLRAAITAGIDDDLKETVRKMLAGLTR